MSETIESLRRKISGAGDLGSVVRTMKALAASNISQYEKAVQSLADYYRTVELGLVACFRQTGVSIMAGKKEPGHPGGAGVLVFGSDQGLVGQFNQSLSEFVTNTLNTIPGDKKVWAVGERVHIYLENAGLSPLQLFPVPNSVQAITPLVTQILLAIESYYNGGGMERVYLFYNRPLSAALYEPVSQCIMPLDEIRRQESAPSRWPSVNLPEVMNDRAATLQALIREYLFISLFRACAESLASENASRLAGMQRAEKNIKELLENLNLSYHRLRQHSIDEELFDVIAGSEAGQKSGPSVTKVIPVTPLAE